MRDDSSREADSESDPDRIVIGEYVPPRVGKWDWDALMTQDSAWGPARKAMRDAARRKAAEEESGSGNES